MLRPGLVSITLRQHSVDKIVELCCLAGLEGIEWGGDIHVPHGDIAAARSAAATSRQAGLAITAYGSYYRLGQEKPDLFSRVLETAVVLGAPIVRVWAGRVASCDATEQFRGEVAADGQRVAEMAARAGVVVATEWHSGTLTDTAQSATALFEAVAHPNLRSYWQPRKQARIAENLVDLDAALPWLVGVHVFHWDVVTAERLPLQNGQKEWPFYLTKAAKAPDMYALLEFVSGDNTEQLLKDAATLRRWLEALK